MMQPRFRQDLVAEPIEDGGTRFIDVADPDSGHVFRFFEVEYSLACAMDGERDVGGIVRWAHEELGLATNSKEVTTVIATLGDLGYLENGAAKPTAIPSPVVAAKAAPISAATRAAPEPGLGAGVVVPRTHTPSQPAPDLELGSAGSAGSAGPAAREDLPKSADLELGLPGGAAAPVREQTAVDDIPLGMAGRTSEPVIERHTESDVDDVSLDLADHLAVKPADVQEAVRASQVMRAVDVPPDLLAEMEAKPERKPEREARKLEPAPATTPPARKVEPAPEPVRAKPEPVRPMPQPVAADRSEPKRPVAPPAQRKVSPALVFVLVVVVLGAAAFVTYKYVLQKSDRTEQTSAAPVAPPVAPRPPPPPALETQKLVTEQPPADEIKAQMAGAIEVLPADGVQVKQGEPVVKMAGYKPIETEAVAIAKDIDNRVAVELANAEKERDAAQAAGNKAGVTAAEAKIADRNASIADKRGKLAAKKAELDKYVVAAPDDGAVTLVAKPGARVGVGDVVAKVVRPPVLVATFTKAKVGERTGIIGRHAWVVVKSSGAKVSCKIVSDAIEVACPKDTASDGAEAVFAGIDTTMPAPPAEAPEIEMGEPAGSAAPAGSAGHSGSAGSAAK
ncbi:MAG TPA: hypothetical protein VGF94_07935 [Kofleriaceae bacterium]|jgi:hypothetical protein